MKLYLLTIALSLSSLFSIGQEKFRIKIYQNTDLFDITRTDYDVNPSITSSSQQTKFNRISIGLQIVSKKGLKHQIELMIPEISKQAGDSQLPFEYLLFKRRESNSSTTAISFRYEVNKSLYSFKNFDLSLGLGLTPYYIFEECKSYSPDFFDRYQERYGASFNIVPCINYKLTNRFGLEISFPFTVYNMQNIEFHLSNPVVPIRYQTVSGFDDMFFSKIYTFRFGVSYSFAKK
jgi:hypothetical protein